MFWVVSVPESRAGRGEERRRAGWIGAGRGEVGWRGRRACAGRKGVIEGVSAWVNKLGRKEMWVGVT
ncbi:hypothetical protein E2C01_089638 [Portunus trituberculatus]|uniref:Uncharacterized protein n=1 Tax=Portunus trituberculatus TaxID=210409 RepID=A0A5B7JMZ5_PORTR|nr:hypothetical protein [Portunus trituberculatus]